MYVYIHSVLRVCFEGNGPDLVCLDIREIHVGPVCRQWKGALVQIGRNPDITG